MKKLLRPFYMPIKNAALTKPIWGKSKGDVQENSYHMRLAAEWLLKSQEANPDGGSASHFDVSGWLASFPETTGYIIPTLLKYADYANHQKYRDSAIKMGEFLLSVQLDNGAFQGGNMSVKKKVPTVFNSGQILFGLCALYKLTNDDIYLKAAVKTGDWMCKVMNDDGCWRKFLSPNADDIPHAYNVRAAWALLKLNEIAPDEKYVTANKKNVAWTLKQQNSNYWFDHNSFFKNSPPFTHNIGYVFRGVLESGLALRNEEHIEAIESAANTLIPHLRPDGLFPSRLDHNWQSKDYSSCLTGNVQLAIIYGKLYQYFEENRFLDTMMKINNAHKALQIQKGKDAVVGALKGSHPFSGVYCPYSFPNWSTKFLLDALLLEEEIVNSN